MHRNFKETWKAEATVATQIDILIQNSDSNSKICRRAQEINQEGRRRIHILPFATTKLLTGYHPVSSSRAHLGLYVTYVQKTP